jgi:26S proteasome regulatory subunit T1
MRPGRLDRRVEFGLPDNEGRAHILRIHARRFVHSQLACCDNNCDLIFSLSSMSVDRDIRFDLIARLCPNSTGAELRSVATEAGMFAIRARRKVATERDFLDAVEKVVRQGTKFSSTYVLNVFCGECCVLIRDFSDPCIKYTTSSICSCSLPSNVQSRILIDRELGCIFYGSKSLH